MYSIYVEKYGGVIRVYKKDDCFIKSVFAIENVSE